MFNLVGILTAVMGKIPFIGQLLAKLWTDNSKVAEIKAEEDNLRFYRLTEPTELRVKQYGNFRSTEFDGPLLV